MKPTVRISTFTYLATIAFSACAILAGCGGDTVAINALFGLDASTTSAVDATVPDGGTSDGASPVDASACGTKTSCSGACVDTATDNANCGSCGNACANGNVCANGTCAVGCNGGSIMCGGACVDQTADPNNCGACGTRCDAGQVCSLGKCAATCASGLTTCALVGGAASDGGATNVCTNALSDPNNCGGCGTVCPAGQLCSNGACAVSCLAGLVQCGSKCVDPTSNNTFCGATAGCGGDAGGSAGAVCSNGQVCTAGANGAGSCATTCAANEVLCGGSCIDPTSDRFACGAMGDCTGANAGVTCASGTICVAPGVCAVTCLAGEVNCNGTCIDPKTNSTSCGATSGCGVNGMGSAGANCVEDASGKLLGEVCSNGVCVANCAQGQVDCDGTCVDPQTNGTHCGASGACTDNTASAGKNCTAIPGTFCSGGTCQVTCQGSQIDCNGTCVDPNTDSNACGAKGDCTNVNAMGSSANSAGATCAPGSVCSGRACVAACAANQVACNGVCVDPATSDSNCGATTGCGVANVGSAGAACPNGTICSQDPNTLVDACSVTCGSGTGLAVCGNACVDTLHDPNNCGTACTVCSQQAGVNNVAVNVCRPVNGVGACGVGSCAPGFADCNGVASDGCEVNLATDPAHCGACLSACAQSGGTETCNGGVCTLAACAPGFADCDKIASNGCEVNVGTDVNNCGTCATKCTGSNGSQDVCANGTCSYGMCNAGFGDCDNNPNNGCETNTKTSVGNCGSCNAACSQSHGSESCNAGSCTAPVCATGFANCNGSAADGCEVDTTTITNCGACGNACSQSNGTEACVAGTCASPMCDPGFADCNGDKTDGCEVNTKTDSGHCGACATTCSQNGGTEMCTNGSCGSPTCTAGFADCNNNLADGCEVNLKTSTGNCGSCHAACSQSGATEICTNGACGITTCANGFADCNNDPADGCEVNIESSTSNCGGCNMACSESHGTETCNAGVCSNPTCATGYGNCDGDKTNGCEANLSTDTTHCGSCATVCSQNDGTEACTNGVCGGPVCNPGFGNCDGNGTNGCETNLTNTTADCGACGAACSQNHATEVCTASTCGITTCAAGYANCNHAVADGCEIDVETDNNNCGACGTMCGTGTACVSGACTAFIDACATAGANTGILAGSDDGVSAVQTIPFPFTFESVSYTTVSLVSNGILVFGPTYTGAYDDYQPVAIPDATQVHPALDFYFTDLFQRTGYCTVTVGTTPNRKYVAEMNDATHYKSGLAAGSPNDHFTLEVILNEADGSLDIFYKTVQPVDVATEGTGSSTQLSVGEENADLTKYTNTYYGTQAAFPQTSGSSVHIAHP